MAQKKSDLTIRQFNGLKADLQKVILELLVKNECSYEIKERLF
jgi:hypothetical protein